MQRPTTCERRLAFTVLSLACVSALGGGCGRRAVTASADGRGAAGTSAADASVDRAAPSPDAGGAAGAPAADASVDHAAPPPDAGGGAGAPAADAFVDRAAPPPDAGFVASIDWFCEQKARALCASLIEFHLAYADEADCQGAEKARCLVPAADWEASAADAGRLVFDPSKVDRCLASPLDANVCDEVLAGHLAGGQRCVPNHGRECASGICDTRAGVCAATCLFVSKAGGPCGGLYGCEAASTWCSERSHLCEPKKAPGASCDSSEGDTELMCTPGNYCAAVTADATPCRFAGGAGPCRCVALHGAGTACTFYQQCADGLICDGGACRGQARAKGDVCGFTAGCAGGLACLGRKPLDDGLPGVCGDRRPTGAPCLGDECQSGSYCEFASNGQGVCRAEPAVGQACAMAGSYCPFGAFCDEGAVCRARPKLGESCAGALDACWGVNVTCDLAHQPPVCVSLPAASKPCDPPCAALMYCDRGTCRPKKAANEACNANHECVSSSCPCLGSNCPSGFCAASCP